MPFRVCLTLLAIACPARAPHRYVPIAPVPIATTLEPTVVANAALELERRNVAQMTAVARLTRVAQMVEAARRRPVVLSPLAQSVTANPSVTASITAVIRCIRDHESNGGNYTESSHPWDGSGADQWIPSSWREWSARAGHPGWQYAYLAPPAIQDAVTAYALTHGGAGNWSMKYGNDPCTAGLPGGG